MGRPWRGSWPDSLRIGRGSPLLVIFRLSTTGRCRDHRDVRRCYAPYSSARDIPAAKCP